ncbi:MAG: hypothetical protein M0R22_03995 [Dehalococcoidia bacterium]|jgi:hypothetical protein|nr:hypothetical protein [Dehalococcoidia bacterium]
MSHPKAKRLRDRIWEELKYQRRPFDGTIGCPDYDEEREPPGYWRKGKFARNPWFWLAVVLLLLLFFGPPW